MAEDRVVSHLRPVARLTEALFFPLAVPGGRARDGALRALLAAFGRMLEVEGAERLSASGAPVLFALNHGNAAEALLAPAALIWLTGGRPVHFLADWMYLELPLIGRLLRLSQPIPVFGKPARWRWREEVRRAGQAQPALDRALALLARGESVGIFPEGTRNGDPDRLRPGRLGLGELALCSTSTIVPVGLHYPAAARLGRIPRLGRTILRVGEPLDFAEEREQLRAAGFERSARRALARAVVSRTLAALAELAEKRVADADERPARRPRSVTPRKTRTPFDSPFHPGRDSA
ncbi:MAG: lysophospholipid acyltransferase family protein [Acidobacteriota bacterium]